MRCPFCGSEESQVKDSRPAEDGSAIRRRRACPDCGARFTTFERVQLRDMTVIKADGKRQIFDRDKMIKSMQVSLRKRPVEPEEIERVANSIVRQLESMGEQEVSSQTIGEYVMNALASLDMVAYIRYASVYKDFSEAKDFKDFLGEIQQIKSGKKSKHA